MKITPVKGTNDYLPNEVEIRDYLQNEILKVYVANGFEHITTPIIEDIENEPWHRRNKGICCCC